MMHADISRIAEANRRKKLRASQRGCERRRNEVEKTKERQRFRFRIFCHWIGRWGKHTSEEPSSRVCECFVFFPETVCSYLLLFFWFISFVFCLSMTKEHSRLNASMCGFPSAKKVSRMMRIGSYVTHSPSQKPMAVPVPVTEWEPGMDGSGRGNNIRALDNVATEQRTRLSRLFMNQ